MTIENIIQDWLNDIEADLVENYKTLGLKASGNWERELEQINRVNPGRVRIGMLGAPYTGAIETGRSKNKNQTEKALKAWVGWAGSTFLKQWVKDKRLNINPFAVAWKIAREGWKVPNKYNAGGLVSDVVTRERINDLNRSLVFSVIEDFKSNVIKDLK